MSRSVRKARISMMHHAQNLKEWDGDTVVSIIFHGRQR